MSESASESLGIVDPWKELALPGGGRFAVGRDEGGVVRLSGRTNMSGGLVLRELDREASETMRRTPLLLGHELTEGRTLVMLAYLLNHGGLRSDETETFLELFVLQGAEIVWQSEPTRVASTNIATYQPGSVAQEWTYLAVNNSPSDDSPGPGAKSDVRVLLRDTDSNGVLDVVIWRKNYEARRLEGTGPDFALRSEDYLVWQFDDARTAYAAPVSMDNLPAPAPELWYELPSIGHTQFPREP